MASGNGLRGAAALMAAAALFGVAVQAPGTAAAADLRIGVLAESEDGSERYARLAAHLSRVLGRDVALEVDTAYGPIVDGLADGRFDIAFTGAAGFASAWLRSSGAVEPLVSITDDEGHFGYYSVVLVRGDRPQATVADLAGARIAMVDPESTSGYQAPRYFLFEEGIEIETHFGEIVFAGEHSEAVARMLRGDADAAATWWVSDQSNSLDGAGATAADVRIVWRGPLMPDALWSVRTDMPAGTREALAAAFMAIPAEAPDVLEAMEEEDILGFREVSLADYEPIIRMVRANDSGS